MNRTTGNLRFTIAEKTRLALPAILSGLVLNIVLIFDFFFPFIPGTEKSLSFTVGCLGVFMVLIMQLLTYGFLKNLPALKRANDVFLLDNVSTKSLSEGY